MEQSGTNKPKQRTMTFIEYLRIPQSWESEAKPFVMDTLRDRNLPDIRSWSDLRTYLKRKADRNTMIAARFVWECYRAALDDEPLA